jgi:hexosaminidase
MLALALVAALQAPPRLVPQPRELVSMAPISIGRGVTIVPGTTEDDRFAARELGEAFRERGIKVVAGGTGTGPVRVRLLRLATPAARARLADTKLRFDDAMREEGYVLLADGDGIDVIGATGAGIFYGTKTLAQLIDGRGSAARVRGARVRDWPAMRWRGFHDDLSRGPVPTLEYQKKQIRTFAAYKLNAYSPYYEHTLAYRSHPLGAPPGGAMTREEVRELVDYARRHHVEVIPEQEAFGHLHHLLKYEIYSTIAETPHGHVVAPGQPGSMALITQLFAEIDTLFPSRFVHLGADETFELGRGQTAERVQKDGIGKVYLGFLTDIERALRAANPTERKRFLFWGDVAMNHPDLVRELPKDLIAVGWWYNPEPRGFDRFLKPFADAGIETWVAPGVNNWSRVYPNFDLALANIQGFIRDGQRLGSTGVLNTSWDDDGEAIFDQTWYGVLFGAAASWQKGESSIPDFQRSYGRVFHGDTTGAIDDAQRKLAAAHALLRTAGLGDGSDFNFWLDPWSDEGRVVAAQIRPVSGQLRVLAESALVLIDRARLQPLRETTALDAIALGARRLDALGAKFQYADEVAQMYDRAYAAASDSDRATDPGRDLSDITGINGRLQDLRDLFGTLRGEYEQAWLRENRPYWMQNVLARYDVATQLWIQRMDRMNAVRRQYGRTRRLPSPVELGIPTDVRPPDVKSHDH